MAFLILCLGAWVLTKTLKQEYTSSYVLFVITMLVLCAETRIFMIPFLAIVYVQTRKLMEEYRRSGLKDHKEFFKARQQVRA